jgi:hypothetical protein
MANELEMQQKIMDALGKLNDRLASLETKTAAPTPVSTTALTTADCGTGTSTNGKRIAKPTASDDVDYFVSAFAAGASLSQHGSLKPWHIVVGALLPAATRSLDESAQGNTSILAPALAPAAISGAAYFLGRYIGR